MGTKGGLPMGRDAVNAWGPLELIELKHIKGNINQMGGPRLPRQPESLPGALGRGVAMLDLTSRIQLPPQLGCKRV